MRSFILTSGAVLVMGTLVCGQELSGQWKLNASRSELRGLPTPPPPVLKVEQRPGVVIVSAGADENGPFTSFQYPLDGTEKKQRVGDATWSVRTKWEGSALLVNTLVSGPRNYTIMERWRSSRDGATLTVKRTIVRLSGETESLLVYENPAAVRKTAAATPPAPAGTEHAPARSAASAASAAPAPVEYSVEAGTRILLSLTNPVNTSRTAPGDRVYLQTATPIFSGGRTVIPRGSYVIGAATESKSAGRVKGKASLYLRFDSITLPNGITRDLRSRIGGIDRDLDRAEGRITGEGAKGRDTRTVGQTTATGATIGSVATRSAAGAGIGAAAGAAAGLIGVLGSRGPQGVLPQGTTMEMVLDRDLKFTAAELESGGTR